MKLLSSSSALFILSITAVQAIPTPMNFPFGSGSNSFTKAFKRPSFGLGRAKAAVPAEQGLRTAPAAAAPVAAAPIEHGIGAGHVAAQPLDHGGSAVDDVFARNPERDTLFERPDDMFVRDPARDTIFERPDDMFVRDPARDTIFERPDDMFDRDPARDTIFERPDDMFARDPERDTIFEHANPNQINAPPILSEAEQEQKVLNRRIREANNNAFNHKRQGTTGRGQASIEQVNEIWRQRVGQDTNPLRTNAITFSPTNSEILI